MNYQAVKEAITQCERCERFIKSLVELDKKSAIITRDNGSTSTYVLLKALMAISAWDSPEFGTYVMPADILAEAIHKSAERVADTVADSYEQARRLEEEGFAVDAISKKKSKNTPKA